MSLPDLIEEGVTGFFCDPLEAESMSGRIQKIVEGKSGLVDLAKHAKETARTRFHPRAVAQLHVEIYRELLGGKRVG